MTDPLVDDLDAAVVAAVGALRTATSLDWHVPAQDLTWTCWETIEHVADDLFAYAGQIVSPTTGSSDYVPFIFEAARDGGPAVTIRSQPEHGNGGLVDVLETCGAMLSTAVRTAPGDRRGWHPYGVSDPSGFAAMGTVEILVHVRDVAEPLDLPWDPPADVVQRVLDRLFPDAPTEHEPWPTLLWSTGRTALQGRPQRTEWRWDGTVD